MADDTTTSDPEAEYLESLFDALGDCDCKGSHEKSCEYYEEEDEPGDSIDDFFCDCSERDTPGDHKQTCELMKCWEYRMGFADWDPEKDCLVMVSKPDIAKPPTGGYTWGSTTTTYVQKCRHYQQVVILPTGIQVFASSSHHDRKDKGTVIPDLGIYLDGCWRPDGLAYHVGCPDYGVPVPSMKIVLQIARQALAMAREGQMIEIGCIGGHGRTGLFLSVLALVTAHDNGQTLTADDAVKYIRKNYCDHAVESSEQEWYLRCIAAELRGEPHPFLPIKAERVDVPGYWFPKPAPKPASMGIGNPLNTSPLVATWKTIGTKGDAPF